MPREVAEKLASDRAQLRGRDTYGTASERTLESVIDELFTYHSPRSDQIPRYKLIRDAAKVVALVFVANVPGGADRTAAIRLLREAVMMANAGIANDGLSL